MEEEEATQEIPATEGTEGAEAGEEATADPGIGTTEVGEIDEEGEGADDGFDDYPEGWITSFEEGESEDVSIESEEEEEEDVDKCPDRKPSEDMWNMLSDEEKKFYSKIYIDIIMDIGTQNRILNDIRKRLCYLLKDNPCPTTCEAREIRGLKCCIKRETKRQELYVKKAKEFLLNSPCGPWDNIPVISSSVSGCKPTELSCTVTDAICNCFLDVEKKRKAKRKKC